MRIPSGKVDQVIYFVAVDANDLVTRKTGLTSFTVYRSRNGGASTLYTTPTVTEISAANQPGEYCLLIDEDTTIASTSDSEEYCVSISQASMARVTRTVELYRSPWQTLMEGTYTAANYMVLFASALLGKASGLATTTAVFRDTGDTKNRISATVDTSGNRTAVTLDAT